MIDTDHFNRFAEDAGLNKTHDPWVIRRKPTTQYASFIIASCTHSDWWFKDYVGVEFFAEIRWDWYASKLTGQQVISEVIPVRLLGVRKHAGRSIPADCVLMV